MEQTGRVYQNKKRIDAIEEAIKNNAKIAILDDGFQDFSVKKDLSIICFNEKQWIGNGLTIPAGPLRESLSSLNRANIAIINGGKNKNIEDKILNENKGIKIFYTKYVPQNISEFKDKKVIAFAGIGNPENFFYLLKQNHLNIVKEISYPDHYLLDEKELLGMPNLKVIGRDNTGHFNDIIVKPITKNKSKTNLTKPTKPKGISDLITDKSDEFGDIVEVLTADGSTKLMSKKDALKLAKKKNKNKQLKLRQETDVLDTWFSSALWPFATLGWPKKTEELNKFYPTSFLVTGFDIIFFWVARMLMMGNYFRKNTPFHKVYVHALVRDEKGQKMSKSKGNVIDPLDLINEYGADSLRFTLISMASPGRDVKLSKDRVTGNRNFITKIWSANNFLKLNNCKLNKKINLSSIKLPINHWIYCEFIKTQNLITKNIEIFRFDEAAKHAYQFVWHSYCDWYLEFLKPIFNSKNKSEIKEAKSFSSFMMANILRILHPFIPFFTENLWGLNAYKKIFHNFLISSSWPDFKKINKFGKNQNNINNLIEIISNIRSTKAELKITPKLYCDIFFEDKSGRLEKLVKANISLVKHVGRVNNILKKKIKDKNSLDILVLKEKISLNFNEDINLVSQRERILQKIESITNQISSLNNKLKNKAYVTNAPKEIVQNDKNLVKELTIEDNKLRSIVSSIN